MIHCTPDHPFWVPELAAYVSARDLEPGTHVFGENGERVEVGAGFGGAAETVYNIEVPTYHNYYAEGVLVHNDSIMHQPSAGGGNVMNFSNSFVDTSALARRTARDVQQAQAAATRQTLLRTAVG